MQPNHPSPPSPSPNAEPPVDSALPSYLSVSSDAAPPQTVNHQPPTLFPCQPESTVPSPHAPENSDFPLLNHLKSPSPSTPENSEFSPAAPESPNAPPFRPFGPFRPFTETPSGNSDFATLNPNPDSPVLELAQTLRQWDTQIHHIHLHSTPAQRHLAISSVLRCAILNSVRANFHDPETLDKMGSLFIKLRKITSLPENSSTSVDDAQNASDSSETPPPPSPPPGTPQHQLAAVLQQCDSAIPQIEAKTNAEHWDGLILTAFQCAILCGLATSFNDPDAIETLGTLYIKLCKLDLDPSAHQLSVEEVFRQEFGTLGNFKHDE